MSDPKNRNSKPRPLLDTLPGQELEYSNHAQQLSESIPSPERIEQLRQHLLEAFSNVISYQEVPCIVFGDLSALELAQAFLRHPIIIKPTLCCVNVAARAIRRDLGFDLDTYKGRLTEEKALALAGYLKPLLPAMIPIPALMELDRYFWTDKTMRAAKGSWEKTVTEEIIRRSGRAFKKRMFATNGETFELDAACPDRGDPIEIGVDVKRIESPRDIHKRADEIINKAAKFKSAYPQSKFYTVVYYPFQTQHLNLASRLSSEYIDGVYFAGATASSIKAAVDLLVGSVE